MSLGLAEPLPSLVSRKFRNALAGNKHLIFSATQLSTVYTTNGVPLQLRYCPALAKKPTASPPPKPEQHTKKFDPFDNPSSDLRIVDIPTGNPTHLLVLNKYPVIEDHFIIATKENKAQTHVLEEDDLWLTLQCLREWNTNGAMSKQDRLFAFFNSGEHSGASQPHRHLQFLPVESMRRQEGSTDWTLLVDLLAEEKVKVPFRYFKKKLTPEIRAQELHQTYQELYRLAVEAVRRYISAPNGSGDLRLHDTSDGSSSISYNLAMTTDAIILCPRRREGANVLQRDDAFVSLNGTVLSGSMMVKDEEEYEALKSKPEIMDRLLASIGLPVDVDATLSDNRL